MSNQHFGVQLEYLLVLFTIIQSIKMCLRTSFGTSSSFYTGSKEKLFQGETRNNREAPPIWLIISIFLVMHLYESKWISVRQTPMSLMSQKLTGFLYVDDTDLVAINNVRESAQ